MVQKIICALASESALVLFRLRNCSLNPIIGGQSFFRLVRRRQRVQLLLVELPQVEAPGRTCCGCRLSILVQRYAPEWWLSRVGYYM
jgi:hypothetical protein